MTTLTPTRTRVCPRCPTPYTDTTLGRMQWHQGAEVQLNGKPRMCLGTGLPPVNR